MKKILIVIGTRPEVIKMAPVIKALQELPAFFETRVCLTAQHREMSDRIIEHFDLKVDYDLDVMRKDQSLDEVTAAIIDKIQEPLADFSPNIVLVQGDTTSAFVGALAGYYRQVQVGHVEAGLRTNDKYAPFPEEMNRRMVAALADHHFAPTERARRALVREGIDSKSIVVTGNTVIDALLITLDKIRSGGVHLGELEPVVENGKKIVLITGHRRENFGDGFRSICEAIKMLAQEFSDCEFVYPVHLNPNVQRPVFMILGDMKNVHLVRPMGYVQFVRLMEAAYIILTDSGGIQEEAPSLGKPVLVMRDVTERPEAVEAGTAIIVSSEKKKIFQEAARLLTDRASWGVMSQSRNPYGDGKAAGRIVRYLEALTL
jgi:UDP-N-acetylglucosamine 2-epimerase (non-hydrolysing)